MSKMFKPEPINDDEIAQFVHDAAKHFPHLQGRALRIKLTRELRKVFFVTRHCCKRVICQTLAVP